MAGEKILLIEDDPETIDVILRKVTMPLGYRVQVATAVEEGLSVSQQERPDLVLLDQPMNESTWARTLEAVKNAGDPPVILLMPRGAEKEALGALRSGARDVLFHPPDLGELQRVITQVLHQERVAKERDWLLRKLAGSNEELEQTLTDTKILYHLGKDIASSLDTRDVLRAVVRAALSLTRAEEGFVVLWQAKQKELLLRAWHTAGENQVTCGATRINDSIATRVLRTGEPVALSSERGASLQIGCLQPLNDTEHMAKSLIYAPMRYQEQTIGVLGVANATLDTRFGQSDLMLLTALADSAAIAIKNAELHAHSDQTLSKVLADMTATQFKTDLILQLSSEGIYTVNKDLRITSVNPAVTRVTGWSESELLGRHVDEILIPTTDGSESPVEQTLPGQALCSDSPIGPKDYTILCKDHRRISVTGAAAPLRAPDGSSACVVVTIQSVRSDPQCASSECEKPDALPPPAFGLDQLTQATLQILHGEAAIGIDDCHPVTLKPIITQVVNNMQRVVPNCAFEVTLAPDLPFAFGSESKIELTLVHLVDNLLHIGDPERPISISARANHNTVIVSIERACFTDALVSAEQSLKLPTSAPDAQMVRGQRRPLGGVPNTKLYLVNRLVEAQGGNLWAESRPDNVMSYRFALPQIEVQDVAQALID